MILNINVYKFKKEYDYRETFLSHTETITFNPKKTVIETIKESFPSVAENDVNLYDIKNCTPVYFAEFDYFYGPVEFYKYLIYMTVEQYLSYSGEEKTIHITFDEIDGAGGGMDPQDIINLLTKFYELVGFIGSTYSALKFANKTVNRGKKALRKYQEKQVQYSTFLNFIYSKEIWTLEELKTTISSTDEEAIDFIMKLCLFGYDKKRKLYKLIQINSDLGEIMTELSVPHQIDVFRGYYELIRMRSYGVEGNTRKYIIENLINKIDVPITNQEIESIFMEMDLITSKVFPEEYFNINEW